MIYINGTPFYDEPGSCGTCEFYSSSGSKLAPSDDGYCPLFDERHHSWATPPRRCQKLFKAAFGFPNGERLVIVGKEKDHDNCDR